jgi:hypothetical protein
MMFDCSATGMKSGRRNPSGDRVVPAQQRLVADDRARRDVEARLEIEFELFLGDGDLEVFLHLLPVAQFLAHAGLVDRIGIAAVVLGGIEADVAVLEQRLGVVGVARGDGDADGCARADGVAGRQEHRFRDGVKQAVREVGGLVRKVDAGLDEGEFVAAETGDAIAGPAGVAQPFGDGRDHGVA